MPTRWRRIDALIDSVIKRIEAGEAVYIYGARIRRMYKVPAGWRYRVAVELEDGRRLEMPPSAFLDKVWDKARLLQS